jgi:hypothetical protein
LHSLILKADLSYLNVFLEILCCKQISTTSSGQSDVCVTFTNPIQLSFDGGANSIATSRLL